MLDAEVFYGCPVLLTFLQQNQSDLQADQDWIDIREKAENERPSVRTVRRNAILAIAFSVEEIALHLARHKFDVGAATLRQIPTPIRAAGDLDAVLQVLEEVSDTLIAEVVHTKMVSNNSLDASVSLRSEQLSRARKALADVVRSTRFLQKNWESPSTFSSCGEVFLVICQELGVRYSRRVMYARTMLGGT